MMNITYEEKMDEPISKILHEFLATHRIMAEVARRTGWNLSTLASELNPHCAYAKFGIDDLTILCNTVREIGYGKEMDGILHEYFESFRDSAPASEAPDNLAMLASSLMAKTAALADGTTKLLNSTDERDLKVVRQMIKSELIPTALRLGSLIDDRLRKESGNPDTSAIPQSS
jgi:hypothetical protein